MGSYPELSTDEDLEELDKRSYSEPANHEDLEKLDECSPGAVHETAKLHKPVHANVSQSLSEANVKLRQMSLGHEYIVPASHGNKNVSGTMGMPESRDGRGSNIHHGMERAVHPQRSAACTPNSNILNSSKGLVQTPATIFSHWNGMNHYQTPSQQSNSVYYSNRPAYPTPGNTQQPVKEAYGYIDDHSFSFYSKISLNFRH